MNSKRTQVSDSSTEVGPSTKRQKKDGSEENVGTKTISSKQPLKITLTIGLKEGETKKSTHSIEHLKVYTPFKLGESIKLKGSDSNTYDVEIYVEDDKEENSEAIQIEKGTSSKKAGQIDNISDIDGQESNGPLSTLTASARIITALRDQRPVETSKFLAESIVKELLEIIPEIGMKRKEADLYLRKKLLDAFIAYRDEFNLAFFQELLASDDKRVRN